MRLTEFSRADLIVLVLVLFLFLFCSDTLAKTEIIYTKNVRAKVAMDFTSD